MANKSIKNRIRSISKVMIVLFMILPAFVNAGIVFDGSMNPDTKNLNLKSLNDDAVIKAEYGKIAGNNLFHSFKEFNLELREKATFAGPNHIQNIFSRVTGNNLSIINGTISSTIDGANLYFLNPHGIFLGKNAILDISGSLYIGTPQYIKMENGDRFEMNLSNSLISASNPESFGFLEADSGIIHLDHSDIHVGLKKNITIISSSIYMNNSIINAPEGDIHLASIASEKEISLFNLSFDYYKDILNTDQILLGNIVIDNNSQIDAGYDQCGNIYILGNSVEMINSSILNNSEDNIVTGKTVIGAKRLSLNDNAIIRNRNISYGINSINEDIIDQGVDIFIYTKDRISLSNYSSIQTESISFGDTDLNSHGGNVQVFTNDLRFTNNCKISSGAWGTGKGGDISIIANGDAIFSDYSVLFSDTDTGQAGNIYIDAKNISFISHSGPGTQTSGSGQGGYIKLVASELLEMKGISSKGYESSITTYTTDQSNQAGDAGNVEIIAKNICFYDGAKIIAGSSGYGQGGDISITASGNINIQGGNNIDTGNLGYASGFYSRSRNIGNAGKIDIHADSLNIEGQGTISTSTTNTGKAGDIYISVNTLNMNQESSVCSESTSQENGGNAGTINVSAQKNININHSNITTDAISSGGGKIDIKTDKQLFANNSQITTSVKKGYGNGGDVTVDGYSVVLNNSKIQANAEEGDGGAIFIKADQFIKSSDTDVEATSKRGNEGSIEIFAPDIDISSSLINFPDNFIDAADWIKTPCFARTTESMSRFIIKNRDALPVSDNNWRSTLPIFMKFSKKSFPQNHLNDSIKAFTKGHFSKGINILKKLLQNCDPINSNEQYLNLMTYLSYAYQSIGHFQKAKKYSQQVLKTLNHLSLKKKALFLNVTAELNLSMGKMKDAIEILTKLKKIKPIIKEPIIVAGIDNTIGNVLFADGYYSEALASYIQANDMINHEVESPLKAAVLINMASSFYEIGDDNATIETINKAYSQIFVLPDSYEKVVLLIALGKFCSRAIINKQVLKIEYNSFYQAGQIAYDLENYRLLSICWGNLSILFELANMVKKSKDYIEKAIFYAEQENYKELIYQWEWHKARIYVESDLQKSIVSYRNSLKALNKIKYILYQDYYVNEDLFDEKIKPVYLELAQLMLIQAKQTNSEDKKQKIYLELRDIIEQMKTAEIESFFNDECISDKAKNKIVKTPENTALLYPISFPGFLVLHLTLPDKVQIFEIDIDSETLDQTSKQFRIHLQDRIFNRYLYEAGLLYDWLIKPISYMLEYYQIKTLVIAPDRSLRLIPFSAFHDGKKFLIEKYAIAIVPAITMADMTPLNRKKMNVCLGGLSESRQGFSMLPNVKTELFEIKEYANSKQILLNKQFTTSRLKQAFNNNDYTIFHFATHGMFGGTGDDAFLLTYDGKLTIDDLEKFIGLNPFRKNKLELLSLSACQTAVGDDRAGLGLAGVAVKSGAKSVMASLWFINDEAASLVTREFYYRLMKSQKQSATVLQEVQKELIALPRFRHPVYWAPFLLIGNWM